MTEISPVAQAVLDAFDAKQDEMHEVTWLTRNPDRDCIAAALRAAADQVVPEVVNAVGDEHDEARRDQWLRIRHKFLAIADELEAQQPNSLPLP